MLIGHGAKRGSDGSDGMKICGGFLQSRFENDGQKWSLIMRCFFEFILEINRNTTA